MVSKFAILTNILLISGVLAVPSSSSRLETRLARRRENRQSNLLNHIEASNDVSINTEYSQNWAGAVWDKSKGTFNTVTGTFTVPTPTGSDGSASAWVGIDGDTCTSAILQTGVDFTIADGQVSYQAWYEWYPGDAYDFFVITFSGGDQVSLTVTASSPTTGTAVIENLSTGETATQQLSSSHPLCQENAEWIIEDYEENGGIVPFANFGMVEFTNATASGSSGQSYTPSGANIVEIKQKSKVLTSVSVTGETVTVKYV